MKYNTTPITNIDDEVFVGGFAGIEFRFEPKEKRFLPTDVSKHLAEHLIKKIHGKLRENKEDLIEPGALKGQILGVEIMTAEVVKQLSFKEEVEKHELEFKTWKDEKDREEILNKDRALENAETIIPEDSPDKVEQKND